MSNVLCMRKALENKMQKHLDMADEGLETGDRLAYEDHMKMAESLLMRISSSTECPQID